MDFKNLLAIIKVESDRLIKYFPCDGMDKETYARSVKLVEEVGELFSEILKHSSLQRKEKIVKGADDLSEEFADVIITTLLLAERMNINIGKALEKKIKKIQKRKY